MHHLAQGKDASPASQTAPERPQPTTESGCIPPHDLNHQHQPSKSDRAKPSCSSPRANATAIPHILLYVQRDTLKPTSPKHAPPTRNNPADNPEPHRTGPPPRHAIQRRTELSKEHP
ncbi:hypothetical protein CRENBAI_016363 [Crenichthys baileyi]|uniref:Uncharacterized protein n=1 Tax=Crenichthys baileyi TaxID=28760 RepID=A0AAV9RA37_9TELE